MNRSGARDGNGDGGGKTLVAVRHVDFEDLGFLAKPLAAAGYAIRYHDAGTADLATSGAATAPLVVVLGGPMGVYESDRHPFLEEEARMISQRLDAGRPTLGICLGAQLAAHALGGRVHRGPVKEIGFAPVTLTDAGETSPLAVLREGQPVRHWHGDTFELPAGATLLASTQAYPHQAFAVGPNLLALQFHIEAGAEIDRWLVGHAGELLAAGIDPERIRSDATRQEAALRKVLERFVADWLSAIIE